MVNLAERIAAAIDRAEQVARQAGDSFHPGWEYQPGVWNDDDSAANAEHIALNDPAAVLRRCAVDRRVLERHHPVDDSDTAQVCGYCSCWPSDAHEVFLVPWPCPDIADAADRWGVEVQA